MWRAETREQLPRTMFINFLENSFNAKFHKIKVNESQYTAFYTCGQRIHRKASLVWLCQYLSFFNAFSNSFSQHLSCLSILFNIFCMVEKRGVTPHCLYRDSLTLTGKLPLFIKKLPPVDLKLNKKRDSITDNSRRLEKRVVNNKDNRTTWLT